MAGRSAAADPRAIPGTSRSASGAYSCSCDQASEAVTGYASPRVPVRRRLHVVHPGVARLVVNELVACRAVPAGLDGGAAGEVTRGVRQVGVPGPPVREQAERSGEFSALGGQLVGGPGWPL